MLDYSKAPTYIVHTDALGSEGEFIATDGNGDTLSVQLNSDGVVINAKQFYSKDNVDTMLTSLRSWVTANFQPI